MSGRFVSFLAFLGKRRKKAKKQLTAGKVAHIWLFTNGDAAFWPCPVALLTIGTPVALDNNRETKRVLQFRP